MKTTKAMLDYLATCSKTSLESFELARLNDLANLRKQMIDIVNEWVEADIQARIAEWVLIHRRQQAALRRLPQNARRGRVLRVKNATLPLFADESTGDSPTDFPSLAPNPVLPVLRDAVLDEPARPLRRAPAAIVKAKRIA